MVLSALRQLVNDKRRDVTSNFNTDAQITRYFNEALRRLQGLNDWEWTQTSTSVAYVSGTTAYAAPTDWKAPISLFYSFTQPYMFVSPEDWMVLSANPSNTWTKKGANLLINSNFGNGTLSCSYYSYYMAQTSGGSLTAELASDTDSPTMPEYYQDALVHYALSVIYQKEGLTDDYQIEMNNWERLVQDLKREFPAKRANYLHRMRHINEFSVGGVYDRKESPLA